MRTTISGLIPAVTLATVIVIAGVVAGQGFATVTQRSEGTVLTPAADYGIRHLDNLRQARAGQLMPMDDYGIRLRRPQGEAPSELTPMDDYGIRRVHDDR